ncbi:helix-turn-helix transcriptional regulator [Saprospira sp. CCB-QB6]|uniref:response regulator transcription factor n=1 Tax=Saprospira sp. CCB-QB6 TaxID=3023936 RepID=UPI00234A2BE9|nr:helix-turn-helix transcriptional regulator [Saprospira sp. CCB-QB6]WCL80748.1 helix-turn-helix transcriptional regulator [Saprospira sp. CCB-QB6]
MEKKQHHYCLFAPLVCGQQPFLCRLQKGTKEGPWGGVCLPVFNQEEEDNHWQFCQRKTAGNWQLDLAHYQPSSQQLSIRAIQFGPLGAYQFSKEMLEQELVEQIDIDKYGQLSARERELLLYWVEGKTANEIAKLSTRKEATVKTQLKQLRKKLGMTTRADLWRFADRLGLLDS